MVEWKSLNGAFVRVSSEKAGKDDDDVEGGVVIVFERELKMRARIS